MGTSFTLYLFDQDSGELVNVVRKVQGQDVARSLANQYYHSDDFAVKVVDEYDGAVCCTWGM